MQDCMPWENYVMHMQMIIPEKYKTGSIIPKNMLIDCIFIAQNRIIISISSVRFTYELVWIAAQGLQGWN